MGQLEIYHGTDARMIEMSDEERLQYLSYCNLVIDNLYPFFKPLMVNEMIEVEHKGQKIYVPKTLLEVRYKKLLDEKGEPFLYTNLFEKLTMVEARNNGSGLYQYDDVYFCSSKTKAMHYSCRSYAGGETGLMAYRLIQGAEIIGFDNLYNTEEVKKAAEIIKDFAKEGNERPAIVTMDEYDINSLFLEKGTPLSKLDLEEWHKSKNKCHISFRYTGPVDFRKCKLELLNEELHNKIRDEEETWGIL